MDPSELERLREQSGLSLDRDGRFLHEGLPVEHPRVLAMLHKGLGRSPDGRPIVRFGETWAYLAVEDTLYRVVQLTLSESSDGRLVRLVAHLDDDSAETVPFESTRFALSPDEVLCLRVKGGAEWARCAPGIHARLGAYLDQSSGALTLRTRDGDLTIGRR